MQSFHPSPQFLDLTLPEGAYRIHHRVRPEQAAALAQSLARCGLTWMEVCHGRGLGAYLRGYPGLCSDQELLESVAKVAPQLQRSVYVRMLPYCKEAVKSLHGLFHMGRIGVVPSEFHEISPWIQLLKKFQKITAVQIQNFQYRDPKQILAMARHSQEEGADLVILSDASGSCDPEKIRSYFTPLREELRIPLGFHGRNNLAQAIPNCLAAHESGVEYFAAALGGMGAGAGITPLETLTALFQTRGMAENLSLTRLSQHALTGALKIFQSLPHPELSDLMLAKHKLYFYPQELLEFLADLLEISLDDLLESIKLHLQHPERIRSGDLRNYLKQHRLDLDVVLDYLKTGAIPIPSAT